MNYRLSIYLLLALVAIVLGACGGSTSFKVSGELKDGANTNLYVKYYGNDAVQTGVTVARNGQFEAELTSDAPTVVEILGNDYRVLGRFYAANGDKINITIDRNNPFLNEIKGTSTNQEWARVMQDNAEILMKGDRKQINDLIEGYIKDHPDNVVSALMFASFYDSSIDALRADSVVGSIALDARPVSVLDSYAMLVRPFVEAKAYGDVGEITYRAAVSDSALIFSPADNPYTLIAISNENTRREEHIVTELKKIRSDHKASKLQIFDLAVYNDTANWVRNIRRDSADWIQAWVPGGILAPGLEDLAIPHIPYYILVDSAGRQLYRGTSAVDASALIK